MNEKTNHTRILYIIVAMLFITNITFFILFYSKLNKLEAASISALDNSENTDNMELLETLEDQDIPLISADELFDIFSTNLSEILSNDADSRSELLVEMIDTIQNNEVMYNNIIRILNQSDDPAALEMIAQLEAKLNSYEQMSQNSFASIIAKLNAIDEKINNLTLGETNISIIENPPLVNTVEVKAGDKIIVSISAAEIADMYGYELKVNYDSDLFEYSGGLSSKIAEIGTIFAKEFDDYVLIGATKIGNQPGFSGKDVAILQLTLTSTTDGSMPVISISDISIVTADMEYMRNIGNWSYNIALAS